MDLKVQFMLKFGGVFDGRLYKLQFFKQYNIEVCVGNCFMPSKAWNIDKIIQFEEVLYARQGQKGRFKATVPHGNSCQVKLGETPFAMNMYTKKIDMIWAFQQVRFDQNSERLVHNDVDKVGCSVIGG